MRVRNFETNALKVNDADGNPVEIAAIVVWQVADTAKAMFAVEYYDALRRASRPRPRCGTSRRAHPYDGTDDTELAARVHRRGRRATRRGGRASGSSIAGVEIIEVRISHLAYAPEIAQAMLQRQQAGGRGRRPHPDRRGRRRHGRTGPGPAQRTRHRRPRRGTQGRDGVQPARRALRRLPGHPGRQHRAPSTNDRARRPADPTPGMPVGQTAGAAGASANRAAPGGSRRSTPRSPSGPPTTCAAPTPTWNGCSARHSPRPAGSASGRRSGPGAIQNPRRCSCLGSRCQSLATLTRRSRWTRGRAAPGSRAGPGCRRRAAGRRPCR